MPTSVQQRLDEVEALTNKEASALVADLKDPFSWISTENKAAAYMVQAMLAEEYPPRDILRVWHQFQNLVPATGIGGF